MSIKYRIVYEKNEYWVERLVKLFGIIPLWWTKAEQDLEITMFHSAKLDDVVKWFNDMAAAKIESEKPPLIIATYDKNYNKIESN